MFRSTMRAAVSARCAWAALASALVLSCGDDDGGEPAPDEMDAATSDEGTGDAGTEDDTADDSEPAGPDAGGGGECTPATCESIGVQCGVALDGCGETLDCGECEPVEVEAGAGPAADAGEECTPETCESLGAECGAPADGCGGMLDCGECTPQACDDAEPMASMPRTARSAHSAGFAGTTDEYFELYDIACTQASDCVELCEIRGGSQEMCGASECTGFEGEEQCLPATVWRNFDNILFESDDPTQGVELTVVFSEYRDTLITDDFQLELPSDAVIEGISVEIRRAGDPRVSDYSVKLVKNGEVVGGERAKPELWTDELQWISYGGAEDLWNAEWTAAELLAEDFGVALSVAYTMQSGNARAYVDQVRVTVHYREACD